MRDGWYMALPFVFIFHLNILFEPTTLNLPATLYVSTINLTHSNGSTSINRNLYYKFMTNSSLLCTILQHLNWAPRYTFVHGRHGTNTQMMRPFSDFHWTTSKSLGIFTWVVEIRHECWPGTLLITATLFLDPHRHLLLSRARCNASIISAFSASRLLETWKSKWRMCVSRAWSTHKPVNVPSNVTFSVCKGWSFPEDTSINPWPRNNLITIASLDDLVKRLDSFYCYADGKLLVQYEIALSR